MDLLRARRTGVISTAKYGTGHASTLQVLGLPMDPWFICRRSSRADREYLAAATRAFEPWAFADCSGDSLLSMVEEIGAGEKRRKITLASQDQVIARRWGAAVLRPYDERMHLEFWRD